MSRTSCWRLQPDAFEAKLSDVRRQVAPAAEPDFSQGYRQLSASSQAASLRHALNGERLHSEVPGSLLQVLLDSGAPGEPVQTFHAGLAEVERVTESLIAAMEDAGRASSEDEAARGQAAETLALALSLVRNRTQLAYLEGLRLLGTLGAAAASVNLSDVSLLVAAPAARSVRVRGPAGASGRGGRTVAGATARVGATGGRPARRQAGRVPAP